MQTVHVTAHKFDISHDLAKSLKALSNNDITHTHDNNALKQKQKFFTVCSKQSSV